MTDIREGQQLIRHANTRGGGGLPCKQYLSACCWGEGGGGQTHVISAAFNLTTYTFNVNVEKAHRVEYLIKNII
jgi:hypothetical protein